MLYQVYRGEYGTNQEIATLLGSITFSNSIEVAKIYAKYPQISSKIYYANIIINHPWINNNDPL